MIRPCFHRKRWSNGQRNQEGLIASRLHASYVDKIEGRIDNAFYENVSRDWRARQSRCLDEIARHHNADQSYLKEGGRLLELGSRAPKLFAREEPGEQRRLLDFVLSNCVWKGGELAAEFRKPFDLIAETKAIAAN